MSELSQIISGKWPGFAVKVTRYEMPEAPPALFDASAIETDTSSMTSFGRLSSAVLRPFERLKVTFLSDGFSSNESNVESAASS
jgi:hypothetical protein